MSSQAQTRFRNAQDHQLASVSTVFFKSNQNTIITLYEVESRKTVNTNLEIELIGFQSYSNRCSITTFGRIRLENGKKVIMHCNAKAYQSILQKPIAKKQKRISRTDQNTSQTCYRKI